MIRIDRPFILYAYCSIRYSGRAKSDLVPGNYLIIRKGDGALMIHGADKMVPLNYQPPGAVMIRKGNKLISKRKDETIEITIRLILHLAELHLWSSNKIKISMTEDDLRNEIVKRIEKLVGEPITETIKEFITPYGNVDLLAVGSRYHVIEIKRGKANMASCTQLMRYLAYFKEIKQETTGWIMSPAITAGAFDLLQKNDLRWAQVHHATSCKAETPRGASS